MQTRFPLMVTLLTAARAVLAAAGHTARRAVKTGEPRR